MTLRVLLWATSLAFLFLALLAVWRLPSIFAWKLALLATEFGHWVVLLPLLCGIAAAILCGGGTRASLLILNTAALLLLLSPAARAFGAARRADAAWRNSRLVAGHANSREPSLLFRAGDLWKLNVVPSPPAETHVFSQAEGFELKLDFFRAAASGRRAAPCVIVVHGGGWDGGERTQFPELNAVLVANGYAVATIDYRLAPRWRWPSPKEDVSAAVRWLRSHANELGIAPDRFVLLGRSAGGQIALAAAYETENSEFCGVISLYGPADLRFAYEYGTEDDTLRSPSLLRAYVGGSPETAAAAYKDASPYLAVNLRTPPTLLIHGAGDTLVWHRQSERLAEKLTAAGTPLWFISLPWATHAFDYSLHGPGGQITEAAVLRFLAAVTCSREKQSGDR